MDDGNRIRSTQTVTDWRQAYKSVHNSLIMPLTAGGRTKDGLYAQLCCADEFGSAPYANGRSDMLNLVNVIQSSMGPRREPMTFVTTTAGTISTGPFIEKIDALHRTLEKELNYVKVEE
jgi:phage terminase large subunit-like protein